MKLAIFIPVFNTGRQTLQQTVDSIIKQTKLPDCVWIVDNHSTDDTLNVEFGQEFTDKVEVIVTRNESNLGRVKNWNKCLELFSESKYDAMKFIFAGDTLDPVCLEEQLNMLSEDIPLVTSGHRVKRFPASYNMLQFDSDVVLKPKESVEKAHKDGNWIGGSSACPMFHKSILGKIRFNEDMSWASDWLFWTQLSEKGNTAFVKDVLANFHMKHRKGYKALSGSVLAQNEEKKVKQYISNVLSIWPK